MRSVPTGPDPAGAPEERERWVEATLGRLDLEQRIGQLMTQVVYGSDADTPDPRNRDRYGVDTPAQVVERFALGGVIYFAWSDNCGHPDLVTGLSAGLQRTALAAASGVPLDLSIDQETGRVTRIGPPATEFPGAMALGATGAPELARQAYTIVGRELAAMGLTTAAAPVADVDVNPANPVIGTRSFGSDPDRVAAHVAAAVHGLHEGGVAATAKHFPGHGDTDTDSHTALPVVTHDPEHWQRIDAPPFAAAIAAGVDVVMTAHLSFPAFDPDGDPATLSAPVLTGLLRERLGFTGVVSTDSLGMAGVRTRYPDGEIAIRALLAGADQLLMSADQAAASAAVLEAVRTGRVTEERITAGVRRILRLKYDRQPPTRPALDVGGPEHLRIAADIADAAVTLLRGDPVLPSVGSVLVLGPPTLTAAMTGLLTAAGRPATTEAGAEVGGDGSADGGDAGTAAGGSPSAVVVMVGSEPPDPGALDRAQATGAPVVGVLTGNPQAATTLTGVPTVLAGYSATDVALAAVARVLTGVRAPTGLLPVTLAAPTAGDSAGAAGAQSDLMNAEPDRGAGPGRTG